MEAFRIFLEHWKVEENKIIKKKTKEKKLKKKVGVLLDFGHF